MTRGTSSNTNNNISDGFSAIAERAFKREQQLSHTPFSINRKNMKETVLPHEFTESSAEETAKNKIGFDKFSESDFYIYFVNYFETMKKFNKPAVIMERLLKTAGLYLNLLNVNAGNDNLNKLLVKIKMYDSEDTFPYLLSVYEDFVDNNISDSTFSEILTTVAEYLKNRQNSGNNVDFNELINYLNAFLACK